MKSRITGTLTSNENFTAVESIPKLIDHLTTPQHPPPQFHLLILQFYNLKSPKAIRP
jgi:hypothetical protein